MDAFVTFTGKTALLDRNNVDTDQIIPKQFLKRVERSGFGKYLFFDWRFERDGSLNPNFELNRSENKNASILITGDHFGCGSSREHAPWALADYGFRVIIAPDFADIFYNNCLKNGLLPIVLNKEEVKVIKDAIHSGSEWMTVDLQNQKLLPENQDAIEFEIDAYWKTMLIKGKDEISITFDYEKQIEDYEQRMLR